MMMTAEIGEAMNVCNDFLCGTLGRRVYKRTSGAMGVTGNLFRANCTQELVDFLSDVSV